MRNLLRENAITIEMHEGGRKLPLAVSASGARYSDGSLTSWTKGDSALLEFVTSFGGERHAFDTGAESNEGGARVFSAAAGGRSIEVTVSAEACTDDRSGWAFDHRMVVEFGEVTYRGCATALR